MSGAVLPSDYIAALDGLWDSSLEVKAGPSEISESEFLTHAPLMLRGDDSRPSTLDLNKSTV